MRTLKSWWAFANDATTLSDAEMVDAGDKRWSPLARVALETAASLIEAQMGLDWWEDHGVNRIEMALEYHPQAFEELSMAIGAALERMWSVVPEAKREERNEKPADPVKYPSHRVLGEHAEDAMAYAFRPVSYMNLRPLLCDSPEQKAETAKQQRQALLQQQIVRQGWRGPGECSSTGAASKAISARIAEASALLSAPLPTPGNPVVRGSGLGRSITMHPDDLMPEPCEKRGLEHLNCGGPPGQRYCIRCCKTF